MGYYYGYHRTSTKKQHLDRGIDEIEQFCRNRGIHLEKIFTDQQSGMNFDRPRYIVLRNDILRPGDTLIVTEVDRLGRNKKETLNELQYYADRGIRVMILEIPTTLQDLTGLQDNMAAMVLDTINHMLIEIYATIAQAEFEKREKRQREGIQKKKDRGEWADYGRPKAMDFEKFKEEYKRVQEKEIQPFALMRELGLSQSTFYRYKKQYEAEIEEGI
ncbi:recombinase family protein [Fusibacillus kribbianus]|uniref:Recombinase family protein n=1 Tax=Fusibacillus kribbianus TaxID=3044208 RepID=A0AAP4EZV6_9FIRM|nr:recombinase family protein [Ruminococcus sp. YH-rum2234]MDI9242335.1 recombinase family protein [Ruminococcus sp. YH-rum2234]